MVMPNYNRIAWLYDNLSFIIFGKKQELAKREYLDRIPDKAKVLVVGGGTGSVLAYLSALNKQLQVDFIEPSAKMMRKAKLREATGLQVDYYQTFVQKFDKCGYQIIITNFFFDNFSQHDGLILLNHLKPKLDPKGILIFSDFINSSFFWDKIVARTMFIFFRITINLTIRSYPSYSKIFFTSGFNEFSTRYIGRSIRASVYGHSLPE
jgi:SAM-dependent methyltransferase